MKVSFLDGNFEPSKILPEQILQTIDIKRKEKELCLDSTNIPENLRMMRLIVNSLLVENAVAAAGIKIHYIKEIHRHGRKGSGYTQNRPYSYLRIEF